MRGGIYTHDVFPIYGEQFKMVRHRIAGSNPAFYAIFSFAV